MLIGKYQNLLYARIINTMAEWSKKEHVPESELYAFLHTLKGTAGTVGLPDMSALVAVKLEYLKEYSEKRWTTAEWQAHLDPLPDIAAAAYASSAERDSVVVSEGQPLARSSNDFILIIDDDHEFVAFLKEFLEQKGYNVSIALTAQKGLELYYQLKPDWVGIDIHLPDQNGFELLTQIVHKARKENTPIAIMCCDDSKENRMLTYTIGALDFFPKPIDPDILYAYLQNRLSYKKEIESAMFVDDLTGAFNRKYFNMMLRFFLSEYKREQQPFCLVMMDLDHFKRINDTYGHPKGDEVLQTFAKVAMQVKRENDLLFRCGGEEFAFILPHTESRPAEALIQRFREALARHYFDSEQGPFQVTFSAGLLLSYPECLHPEEMMNKVDQALYHAKQSGRNRTVVYRDQLSVKPLSRFHVIIIDDVFIVRETLSEYFHKWVPQNEAPVMVSEYADGESFLRSDWYRESDLHVILLDGMLPNLDGIEVLKQIRGKYPHHNVMITMLTARSGGFDVINAIKHGADDYIIKPFQAQEVSARVQRLISRKFA